jgi:RNA polymerase sigma-70 factor (ECF subfamily)
MSAEGGDFTALLARARGGDRSALDLLAREYEPKLRLVARVALGPALRPYLDSVDLVQSVHRSLMIGLRDQKFAFESPENLLALAATMVRRKAARHWRRLQRQQRLSAGGSGSTEMAPLLGSLTPATDDPARAAQSREEIARFCESLTEPERCLIELRLQGYTPAECSAEMGLSPVAFRVRLTRLRQRLRAAGVLDDWL